LGAAILNLVIINLARLTFAHSYSTGATTVVVLCTTDLSVIVLWYLQHIWLQGYKIITVL